MHYLRIAIRRIELRDQYGVKYQKCMQQLKLFRPPRPCAFPYYSVIDIPDSGTTPVKKRVRPFPGYTKTLCSVRILRGMARHLAHEG
jgi:hypothetical protein